MNVTKDKLCEMVYSSLNESLPGGEKSSEYTHKKIEIIVDELFLGLAQNLKKKNPIEIRGFGRFYIAESKEKKGRNFRTGETIIIPSKQRIKFNPSPDLYDQPAKTVVCENEHRCISRISTIIRIDRVPVKICRYYYRCPSRTQDLFQNDSVFSKNARVLNVTTGVLVHANPCNQASLPRLYDPLVIIYCETKVDKQKVKLPDYFVIAFDKYSVSPIFNSGPALVSFNNQTEKCYVRNSGLDCVFEINKHYLKNDEVLRILLNAKFKKFSS